MAISSPSSKICTVAGVARASARRPMCRHGTEYNVLPTLTCRSGPTVSVDQVHERAARQRQQRLGLDRGEHRQRGRAGQWTARTPPGHL
ncbi:MAG TPA: hypothetical protein VFU43_14070 [Streptosporangiaceae bacterium]|nr:hypothetical protein [Streptosporangiaceae bacterium]